MNVVAWGLIDSVWSVVGKILVWVETYILSLKN